MQTAATQVATSPAEGLEERTRMLWTGGWDSSFRLLQLVLIEQRPVQPIYVLSTKRDTALNELRAMRAIRDEVLPRLGDPALLAPTQIVLGSDYPPPPHVTDLAESMRTQVKLGTQYEYLASVADALGWSGVEMSVEKPNMDEGYWVSLVFSTPPALSDAPEAALFKYWSFPITHLSKNDMIRIAGEWKFLDLLLEHHWSCQDPLGGKQCGRCRSCSLSRGMGVEVASPALVRGRQVMRLGRRAARRALREAAGRIIGEPARTR